MFFFFNDKIDELGLKLGVYMLLKLRLVVMLEKGHFLRSCWMLLLVPPPPTHTHTHTPTHTPTQVEGGQARNLQSSTIRLFCPDDKNCRESESERIQTPNKLDAKISSF